MRAFMLAVTGLVVGVIACTSGGTAVEVERTPVAAITVQLPATSLTEGQTARAVATPLAADGSPLANRPVVWQSSISAVATVSESGMIAAVSPGHTVISAASEGVSGQANMDVVAPLPVPVAAVSVALSASSATPGQSAQATATTLDANNNVLTGRSIAWSSSNSAVATISGSGAISAVAVGTTQITATSEGVMGSATFTVTSAPPVPVASVTVSLAASSRNPGETTQATATTRDANNNVLTGRVITWSSSNTSVATVSSSGLVTAVAAGTTQIKATSEGQSGSATLTVAPVPVASVSVSLAASSRNPGQTTQATATTRDANNNVLTGRVITWSSSNTGVATVSSSGLVTAIAVGAVQIIAACEGQRDSAALTVVSATPPPVASVTVALGNNVLNPGASTQATATTRDANNNVLSGRTISWSSSDTTFAKVSQTGLVTAVAAGSAQITATSEGQSGAAQLTVQLAGASNEPSGMTVITDRPFDALGEMGWDDNGSGGAIIQDPTAPRSPSSILRTTLPKGFTAGGGTFSGDLFFPGKRTLYISYWARLSSNWQGQSADVNKQFYAYTNGTTPNIYFDAHGAGSNPLVPQLAGQDIIAGGIGGDPLNPDWNPNLLPSAQLIRGSWYHIEVVLVGNTSGSRNGSIDWYLDGVHIGSYSGIQFQSGAAVWTQLHYTNLWGGGGGTTAQAQTLDFDHLYISAK